jgi:uncharacterized MnhB-related membrane protein
MKKYLIIFVVSILIVVCGAMLKIFEVNFASWVIVVGAISVLGSLLFLLKNILSGKN